MPTQRMIRWRLLLEEFNPKMVHVSGPENEAADALSRLDMDDNTYDEIDWLPPHKPLTYSTEVRERINLLYPMASEQEMNPDTGFPLATDLIRFYQERDDELQNQVHNNPDRYTHSVVEGETLIMKQGKIVIPPELQPRVLDWYHEILVHPGENRMEKSLTSLHYWKNLEKGCPSALQALQNLSAVQDNKKNQVWFVASKNCRDCQVEQSKC